MNLPDDAPYHAHIYFKPDQQSTAEELKGRFEAEPDIIFVGVIQDKSGPHPLPQLEVHFRRQSLARVRELILASDSSRQSNRHRSDASQWARGIR